MVSGKRFNEKLSCNFAFRMHNYNLWLNKIKALFQSKQNYPQPPDRKWQVASKLFENIWGNELRSAMLSIQVMSSCLWVKIVLPFEKL